MTYNVFSGTLNPAQSHLISSVYWLPAPPFHAFKHGLAVCTLCEFSCVCVLEAADNRTVLRIHFWCQMSIFFMQSLTAVMLSGNQLVCVWTVSKSSLAERFSAEFSNLNLVEVLAEFSLPSSLREHLDTLSSRCQQVGFTSVRKMKPRLKCYCMVALWNRETIYIFMLWFVLVLVLLFFPRLISAAADWMSAMLPHMVWP